MVSARLGLFPDLTPSSIDCGPSKGRYPKGPFPSMDIARNADKTQRPALRAWASPAICYASALVIPFAILLATFALLGIYPFGDVSVMVHDMPVQYADYFGWLIQVMHGEGNLLYSNAAGLGGGMFSLFTYYLSSPFNLLAWFFTPETVPQLLSWLTLLKIPACAAACLGFLRGRFLAPEAATWREARALAAAAPATSQGALVLLSCAYALSSYVLGYASNIMWLDGVIMAPCALLGVWRLIQRRSCAGLFAAAAGAIWFNWYTGYMVCLLCVLYFLYELARSTELRGRRLRTCGRFAAVMSLAVGAGMVALLPTALSLLGGKGAHAGLASLAFETGLARNPLAVPDLFCIGTTPGITTQANRPAVVISAFALVGAGTFFANKAIVVRDRVAGGVFAGIMLASLVLPPLTTIWAGFVPESSYTNRNAFAILLVLVMLAAESLLALRRLPARGGVRAAIGGGIVLAAFAVSAAFLRFVKHALPQKDELVLLECILLAGFTALIAALALIGKAAGDDQRAHTADERTAMPKAATCALCALLVAAFIGEQAYDAQAQLRKCIYTVSGYAKDLTSLEDTYATLSAGQDGFVRVGNTSAYWSNGGCGGGKDNGPDNMALMLAYSTFDHYSSTQESRIQELLRNLGYSKVTPFGTYYMSPNTVADALLGVTNIIDDEQPAATQADDSAVPRESWRAWRNELALPLGWGTTGTTQISWGDDPFANQASMLADAAELDESAAEGLFTAPDVRDANETETGSANAAADGNADASSSASGNASRQFAITARTDGPLLLFFPTLYLDDIYYEGGIACSLSVDGADAQTIGRRGSCNIVYAGTVSAGQTVTVKLTPANAAQVAYHDDGSTTTVDEALYQPSAEEVVKAQVLDLNDLQNQLSRVDSAGFALTTYENGRIAATFAAAQDETLVVSQPYEDGWTATVNGQPVELQAAYDGLMGIPVQTGDNVIELRYFTPGLVPGAVVGIASVTLFAVWRIAARRRSMLRDGE